MTFFVVLRSQSLTPSCAIIIHYYWEELFPGLQHHEKHHSSCMSEWEIVIERFFHEFLGEFGKALKQPIVTRKQSRRSYFGKGKFPFR